MIIFAMAWIGLALCIVICLLCGYLIFLDNTGVLKLAYILQIIAAALMAYFFYLQIK